MAPFVGGITISFAMELLVYPVIFYLAKQWELRKEWTRGDGARSDRGFDVMPAGPSA